MIMVKHGLKQILGDVEVGNCSHVEAVINLIKNKENDLQIELENLLSKQCQIESIMSGVSRDVVMVNEVCRNSNKLDKLIAQTKELAESVSVKVRRLDVARIRVSECQKRVHDLIDLQLCRQGVINSIADGSFEIGAGHISRFLAMDLQLLKKTADDVQSSGSSVSDAIRTLENATVELRGLIVRKFNEAVKKDDLASVERFFKIFPLLGLYKEGLEKFSYYICLKLSIRAQKELSKSLDIAKVEKRLPLAYADAMTSLLENFARVVEVNQPIIETCYGTGHLLEMIRVLQHQCDIDIRSLLFEFNKNRKISITTQKVNEVFSRNSAVSNSSSNVALSHYRNSSGGSTEKINPKDIDTIIAEITIMHSRAELYFRFMKRRVAADIAALDRTLQQEKLDALNKLLNQSDLSRQMQELLGIYLLFERYFMEESVVKAITLDIHENGQLYSSMVDDVFFILRKSIRRSLSSQSVNGTCAVINNAATCLASEFVIALRTTLKLGYPSGYIDLSQAYSAIQITLQQGRIQASDSEKSRIHFLVQLNNVDMSTEYIQTLWQTMEQEIKSAFPAITNAENQLIESCLAELKTIHDTLKACLDFGMQQLRLSVIKPRLHPWVDEFLNYKHNFTEEELASYEAGETFVQYLIVHIDSILNTFKQNLTPRNADALISIVATELTLRLERAIKKCTYNRLGGLVLDQEVRLLGAYLANATSWSVRDKLTRLTQIATILNLEKVSELNDYLHPDNGLELSSWRITLNEVRTILTLRTDFRMEDIKRIRF